MVGHSDMPRGVAVLACPMDASAGGERGPVRLSSTAGHCATRVGRAVPRPTGPPISVNRDGAAPGGADATAFGATRLPGTAPTTRPAPPARLTQLAAATTSGIRKGLPQPPQTMGACARTDGTTRTLRPQSQTALTRTPPPDEPCRAAGRGSCARCRTSSRPCAPRGRAGAARWWGGSAVSPRG